MPVDACTCELYALGSGSMTPVNLVFADLMTEASGDCYVI